MQTLISANINEFTVYIICLSGVLACEHRGDRYVSADVWQRVQLHAEAEESCLGSQRCLAPTQETRLVVNITYKNVVYCLH